MLIILLWPAGDLQAKKKSHQLSRLEEWSKLETRKRKTFHINNWLRSELIVSDWVRGKNLSDRIRRSSISKLLYGERGNIFDQIVRFLDFMGAQCMIKACVWETFLNPTLIVCTPSLWISSQAFTMIFGLPIQQECSFRKNSPISSRESGCICQVLSRKSIGLVRFGSWGCTGGCHLSLFHSWWKLQKELINLWGLQGQMWQ